MATMICMVNIILNYIYAFIQNKYIAFHNQKYCADLCMDRLVSYVFT